MWMRIKQLYRDQVMEPEMESDPSATGTFAPDAFPVSANRKPVSAADRRYMREMGIFAIVVPADALPGAGELWQRESVPVSDVEDPHALDRYWASVEGALPNDPL